MASWGCGGREVTGSPLPPQGVLPEAGLVSLTAHHGLRTMEPCGCALQPPCPALPPTPPTQAVLPTHWEVQMTEVVVPSYLPPARLCFLSRAPVVPTAPAL